MRVCKEGNCSSQYVYSDCIIWKVLPNNMWDSFNSEQFIYVHFMKEIHMKLYI